MPSLLKKVRTKLSIETHQKVRSLLEGQYGSVFKGRSMDFEDLREYIIGDDIKDIDWKATARSGQTLIRRYIAIRKHNILFVVDTGRNMAAASADGNKKSDVIIFISGVLGSIAQKHGDLVAMVAGNNESSSYFPLKSSDAHLERLLQHIDNSTGLNSPDSNIARQLEYVAKSIRRRMMLVIIADESPFTAEHEQLVRRLRVQHEILWITVADADIQSPALNSASLLEVKNNLVLPSFVTHNKKILDEFESETIKRQNEVAVALKRLSITNQVIRGETDTVKSLIALLEKQKHVRK